MWTMCPSLQQDWKLLRKSFWADNQTYFPSSVLQSCLSSPRSSFSSAFSNKIRWISGIFFFKVSETSSEFFLRTEHATSIRHSVKHFFSICFVSLPSTFPTFALKLPLAAEQLVVRTIITPNYLQTIRETSQTTKDIWPTVLISYLSTFSGVIP